MARLARLICPRDVAATISVQRSMQRLGEKPCGPLSLAMSPSRQDNVHVHRGISRSLSHVQEETLRGKAGGNDQGSNSSRSSEASPGSGHATSARAPAATKESDGTSSDRDEVTPECERLETTHGGIARNPAGVGGRREGRAAVAPADSEPPEAPWAESDGVGTPGGCERARGGPLGGRTFHAGREESWFPGGATETGEARSKGVTRSRGQRDQGAEASHSQACAEAHAVLGGRRAEGVTGYELLPRLVLRPEDAVLDKMRTAVPGATE